MKISYRWLKDYVDISAGPDELAEMLTMAGLEVESVEKIGYVPDGVVVGEVLEVRKHPDADRLTVCKVDVGGGEPLQIVCGAPNVAPKQKVPVAAVGSTLRMPDRNSPGHTVSLDIRRAKIRGMESEGMICAEDELGLSDDHSGIMVLPDDAPIGTLLSTYLESVNGIRKDAVLDVAITPNRPDAACHVGVARDVAALTGESLHLPDITVPDDAGDAVDHVTVAVEDPDLCRRYVGVVVTDVAIGESPEWLRSRLESVGLRPRNNVVDITNFVMYECGQPLHAFDLDRIAGSRIVVRATRSGSSFTTLDDVQRSLPAGTLMICDAEREVAIAGVMGGQNSEVSDATVNVLIESAYFDPASVRRTSKALGLQTDASYRFERGVDSSLQVWAAMRAAHLMAELAGGTVVSGAVDAHPNPMPSVEIALRPARLENVLGLSVPRSKAAVLLDRIGFKKTSETDDAMTFRVPGHRPDVEREIDLIEEVARLYGYDRIEEPTTTRVPSFTPRERRDDVARQKVLSLAAGWDYREIYTNSLLPEGRANTYCDPALLGDLARGVPVKTANAISRDMSTLRPSLLPGALDVIRHNLNHGRTSVKVIEFGHVFTRQDRPENIVAGFEEHESLLLACAGLIGERHWGEQDRQLDFFDLKGALSAILSTLGIVEVQESAVVDESATTQFRVDVTADGRRLGSAGMLHRDRCAEEGIEARVYFAELNWSRLVAQTSIGTNTTYVPVDRFPTVERDLAFVVNAKENVGPMVGTIRREGAPLLADVSVFDVYVGKNLGAGRKSVAFALRFSADRTLTDAEVERQVKRIVEAVQKVHGAELRD